MACRPIISSAAWSGLPADLLAVAQQRLCRPSLSLVGPAEAIAAAEAAWQAHALSGRG